MNLHEYQAKALLRKYDIPTPLGMAAANSYEASMAAVKLGRPHLSSKPRFMPVQGTQQEPFSSFFFIDRVDY